MKLLLIFLGKPKPPTTASVVDEYVTRLQRLGSCDVQILRPEKVDRRPPDAVKTAEGARILQVIRPDDWVAVCDENGKPVTTTSLVAVLRAAAEGSGTMTGKRRLVVVLGGALGLGQNIRHRADQVWALSGLTLAESVARIVLVEGLYRAMTVIKGHPYHNA